VKGAHVSRPCALIVKKSLCYSQHVGAATGTGEHRGPVAPRMQRVPSRNAMGLLARWDRPDETRKERAVLCV
jgi:hypothetical protein